MVKNNDIRQGRHCVFLLHVHLVFVTKYRREVFTKKILDDLRAIFASVCTDFEAELIEFDGEDDHVHLLAHLTQQPLVRKILRFTQDDNWGVEATELRNLSHQVGKNCHPKKKLSS